MLPAIRFRLEPRLSEPAIVERALRLGIGLALALVVGALVIAAAGYDPAVAYAALARGDASLP